MKHAFVVIFLVHVYATATQKIVKEENSVVQFVQYLDRYYIEPGWVIFYLKSLPLSDFDDAWEIFVTTFCYEPWRCFVVDKKKYSEKKYRTELLAYFEYFDYFLKSIAVDSKLHQFFLVQNRIDQLGHQDFITIFEYWKKNQKTTYQIFYAFYFDTVAALFNETVIDAWSEIDTPDYQEFSKKAFQLMTMLYSLFAHLEGGVYDRKYAHHLQRFGEVIHVLETERQKRFAGIVA